MTALRQSRLSTRLLLTSGYTAREVRDRMEVDPAIPFLPKPWTADELLGKVREALDEPSPGGPFRRRATDRS